MSNEWRPSRYTLSQLGVDRVSSKLRFDPKQVHTTAQLLAAADGPFVFHKAVVDSENGTIMDQSSSCTFSGMTPDGNIKLQLQGQDGLEDVTMTPSELGLVPFPDGTWTASQYISYGTLKKPSA